MAEENLGRGNQVSWKKLEEASESFPFGFLAIQDEKILSANTMLAQMCGCRDERELLHFTEGSIDNLLLEQDFVEEGKSIVRLKKANGSSVCCRCEQQSAGDATQIFYLFAYDEDHDQNVFDSISGLYQKEYLFDQINDYLKDSSSIFHQGNWNMIFVNISGFRGYNDENGYSRGNHLLRAFSKLLVSIFDTRLATRVYADQFAVLYQGEDVEEKIRVLHEQAIRLSDDFNVWVHAGIYQIKDWNEPLDVMLDYARTACSVSHKTKQFSFVYSDELRKRLEKRKYIISHVDEAIEKGWIVLYFQPVIRTLSGKICSGEALARWNDPVYGMISPGEFVPVLEENRLSYKLAQFVIDNAAGYISESERMGMYPIPVSINLSRRDFDDMDPFEEVEKAVKKYGISRNLLCIEITESTVMDHPQKIKSYITRFHDAGYEVWMDDFGSAYSSLNTLKDFYFDEIKLDMAFMRNFNDRAQKIVSNCLNMAKDLGIHTLCEGVETKQQVEFLLEHGCEKIQGFYYSKPRPVHELKEMIDSGEFGYELSVERFLYDESGKIKMDPNTASAVVLCVHDQIYPLELSRRLKQKMEQAGMPKIALRRPLELDETEIGHKLSVLLQNCRISKEKEEVSYFLEGRYYALKAELAGASNAGSICTIVIRDITESARSLLLGNAGTLPQSLTGMYDCIYRLDSSCSEIQVVVSDFTGEMAGRSFLFDPESMCAFIYWKDRARFRSWIDASKVHAFLEKKDKKCTTDLFRLEKPDGSRVWELFALVRSSERKKEEIYLCMRKADVSLKAMAEMLAEKEEYLDPALLHDNQSVSEHTAQSFYDALMEQDALKIFFKDKDRRFTNVSRSFLEYFGLSSMDSIAGKRTEEFPWLLDGKNAVESEEEVLEKGQESSFSFSSVLVNGVVKNTVVLRFPVYENGEINGIAGVFADEEELSKAIGQRDHLPFIDPDTGVMNFLSWMQELSSFEDSYNHEEKDYAVGVLMIRSYWKTYHEFGWKTAEQMAKITAETIRAELPSDCMIGRMDKETFVIATTNTDLDLKKELKEISSLLSSTHYINAYEGAISSYSAASFRSETSNLMRTISLALEKAENQLRLKTMSNERSPRISAVVPETPKDLIVTVEEVDRRIEVLLHTFDFVRLVDPDNQKIIRYERNGVWKEQKGNCFDVWQTGQPCENCVSRRALKTKQKLTKFETDGENVFIVIAQYLEVEGRGCVLEMVMRMHDASSLGADERGIFIRTLANCRSRMYEDTLTGIHNRRYYEDVLADHKVDACALIDIDALNHINQTYGHLAGDTVLRETAHVIASFVQVNDLVRYEGDRFLIGFTKIKEEDCREMLQKILMAISKIHFETWPALKVKAYAGCVYQKGRIASLLPSADDALSKAEKDGADLNINH